jgi:YjbE family integral membrane protein
LSVLDWSADFFSPEFWWAVFGIFVVNGLLSGDNAVLIALACRGLPPRERLWGMVIGAGVASVLLIAFTAVVSSLMQWPYLRFVSGLILVWIAIKLAGPAPHDEEGTPEAAEDLWRAVRIVVIADIVMSLDNVVAVAALANGRYVLVGLGLVISIPIVIAGSALVLALLERVPILIWAGAAILGWVAGGLLATDPIVQRYALAVAQIAVGIDSRVFGGARHYDLRLELDLFKDALALVGATVVVLGGLVWRAASSGRTDEMLVAKKEHRPAE